MKKLLIALAFVGLGTAANAQSTQIETPSKYTVATNSFWSNWYVQFGVDMSVMNPYKSKFFTEDWHNGRTYGIDLAIGKWFTPGIGVRTKVQWENGLFAHAFRNTDHVIWLQISIKVVTVLLLLMFSSISLTSSRVMMRTVFGTLSFIHVVV